MLNETCHIPILPNARRIETRRSRGLIESLMDQSIFLRSDCGGKGICEQCRVKMILNNGDHEQINACTYKVSENIKIEIPESSMLSSHIISKAPVSLPKEFTRRLKMLMKRNAMALPWISALQPLRFICATLPRVRFFLH